MKDGFLGYRTSFMLDFVVVALVLIVPVLVYSLIAVKVQRRYVVHRRLQLLLGAVLLVAVGLFEVDLQWVQGGWLNVVGKREVALTSAQLALVRQVLRIHLYFAISTPLLWATTIGLALRHMPSPPQPCPHSKLHKTLGWLSTIDLILTSITGLVFYYFAFVAT
jgi:putative membrane protein